MNGKRVVPEPSPPKPNGRRRDGAPAGNENALRSGHRALAKLMLRSNDATVRAVKIVLDTRDAYATELGGVAQVTEQVRHILENAATAQHLIRLFRGQVLNGKGELRRASREKQAIFLHHLLKMMESHLKMCSACGLHRAARDLEDDVIERARRRAAQQQKPIEPSKAPEVSMS